MDTRFYTNYISFDFQDIMIENQGIDKILPCLASDASISKAAIELLYVVLLDKSGWSTNYCQLLSLQTDVIPCLVALLKSPDSETSRIAEDILVKLCETDENVIQAAMANWFWPLINKVTQG